jgi:RimJ/RimL family protein N-acetyltransferase
VIDACLIGGRLALTPMTGNDVPDIGVIAADEAIFRYIPDIPLPFDAGRWVRSVVANDAHCLKHVIRLRPAGDPIGFLQVGQRRNGDLQIGYFLARSQWGQGFAREACLIALGFLRAQHERGPVHAAVHRDNHASIRMLEALEFLRVDVPPSFTNGMASDMVDYVLRMR